MIPQKAWQHLTIGWYGEGQRTLELCSGTAWGYRFGSTPFPIRWALTRDPAGKRLHNALFSTDLAKAAKEIVRSIVKCWRLETTFEESWAHLGIEAQRDWSDRAIERTTPLLFGLYRLVALFGSAQAPDGALPTPASGLVPESSSCLQRYPCTGEAASVGQFCLFHIPF